MPKLVLLGDSIFDNARYVATGRGVIEQLCERLPAGWSSTLLAVDGATVANVYSQIEQLPEDASHLLLSVGGNDALGASPVLEQSNWPATRVFAALAEIQQEFRTEYLAMLRAVLSEGKPTAVCTIYDSVPGVTAKQVTALSVFNDIILREAFSRGLPVLDLRLICDEPRDYSSVSPIEPSENGGAKISQAIVRLVVEHDFSRSSSVVYGKRSRTASVS